MESSGQKRLCSTSGGIRSRWPLHLRRSRGSSSSSVLGLLRRDLDIPPGSCRPGVQHQRVLLSGLELGKVYKHLQQHRVQRGETARQRANMSALTFQQSGRMQGSSDLLKQGREKQKLSPLSARLEIRVSE